MGSHELSSLTPARPEMSIELARAAWLDAKQGRSGSVRTGATYAVVFDTFRSTLHAVGLDVDSDPHAVALVLQAWCGRNNPSPATYNLRRSIVSSFYTFALQRGLLALACNPATLVERRTVAEYDRARGLEPTLVRARLAAIDRTTLRGLRDYALLTVTLATGRRVAEIAGLRWRHVTLVSERVTLEFRVKGGRKMHDTLPPQTGRALLSWLTAWYSNVEELPPDAPLWPALSAGRGGRKGEALKPRQLQNICRTRLGTHFHALRHTFARTMDAVGAPITVTQARLGHQNLATTSRYVAALQRAENPFGIHVETLFISETLA
ncbi:MAG: site-specific integrase [Candidatus Kapabacteria bacterium]|nr:site-specific integrase [Candidatus Kapabacteria bacterium]